MSVRSAPGLQARSSTAAARAMRAARAARPAWAARSVRERLDVVRRARRLLAERADAVAGTVSVTQRRSRSETLSAEILPLAAAWRFLERRAARLLAPRREGRRGRPLWLAGTRLETTREPFGVVLVIAPSNYPLLLAGVQVMQALVAGNAVLLKPGRGGAAGAAALEMLLRDAGLPAGVLHVLGETVGDAEAAIDARPDKVVLTGSVEAGRAVLGRLAESVTPAVVELSGCDPVFVLDGADLDLAARALAFGVTLNGGFTCIAPRRVFVARSLARELEERLVERLLTAGRFELDPAARRRVDEVVAAAGRSGARLVHGVVPVESPAVPIVLAFPDWSSPALDADLAAPLLALIPVADADEALRLASGSAFALGASVFGPERAARDLATRIEAGVVVVNDMIVPTADPRVPFGGRRLSGFGVTRGAEGLLEMTVPKSVVRRSGTFRPHFDPVGPAEARLLEGLLQLSHASAIRRRLAGLVDVLAGALGRGRRPGRSR